MTFAGQSLTMDFGFAIGGTEEIAQTGLRFTTPTAGWTGAATALAELDADASFLTDIIPVFLGVMESGGLSWADYSDFVSIKVAAVGTNGLYLAEPLVHDGALGSGSSTNIIPQSTVVLSLRSGFTLGQANYGRMYLPHTRMTLSTSPLTAQGNCDVVAADGADMVNGLVALINAITTDSVAAAIMSAVGSGTTKLVSNVQVGNVNDVQRRRRNRLPETYSVTDL